MPSLAVPFTLPATLTVAGPARLPTRFGTFQLYAVSDAKTGKEHAMLTVGDWQADGAPVLLRVHSECLTGDAFHSQRCDCGDQLEEAMRVIAAAGQGVILYLRQEGRGIGLLEKVKAYLLQEGGLDTLDANLALGHEGDARDYQICRDMLAYLGVTSVRLLTNNPHKLDALAAWVTIADRVPFWGGEVSANAAYLATKQARMGHLPA